MPRLLIEHVTKVYPTLRKALDGVTFGIGPGVFGLLGPNGAGKSTMMAILAGALDFEDGRVAFDDGVDVRRHPAEWRRRLAWMPQSLDFVPHLKGREYLEQCALLSGLRPRALRGRMDELLERVGLTEAARRDAATYSRGMKQRLAAAGALLCEPDLALLDEPTSGLDPQERVLFRELLAAEGRGRIIILSTHIVADVERCCGRAAVIAGGRTLFDGAPAELLRRVEGRVWETPIEPDRLDEWAESRRLVALRHASGQVVGRVVGAEAPSPAAIAAAPRLEDAYVSLVGEAGIAWADAAAGEES